MKKNNIAATKIIINIFMILLYEIIQGKMELVIKLFVLISFILALYVLIRNFDVLKIILIYFKDLLFRK